VTLPPQVVDQSGQIDVPFGGRFRAAGNTPRALGGAIERALVDRAIEPQVLVSTVESTSNTVSVLGEAGRTGQIELSPRGDRLLDVLAKAGAQVPETESVIRLVRDNQIQTVPLRTVINVPSENIYILPGDTIFVLREPQVFNALGAVQSTGQYPITFADQTIAGAISLAGGLSPVIADRGGVFIFRFETVDAARQLLPPETDLKITPMGVPIVYQVSFLNPNSFFWLQQVNIRNNDLIYVANAVVTELDKFLTIAERTNLLGL
jgi:polysaccharide export outer membrane protein